METVLQEINGLLPGLSQQYHRLILVIGPAGAGKTRLLQELSRSEMTRYLNVNLTLSQRLLDLTRKERPLRIRRLLGDLINAQPETTLALDNIELLFEPSLQQDPLNLLKSLSRTKSLVVAWGGYYDQTSQTLGYAEPGHPEYRRYEQPDVIVMTLDD